ncbi:MAG: hypothetical protein ACU0BF_12820 [Paracoccaceae bacterium]
MDRILRMILNKVMRGGMRRAMRPRAGQRGHQRQPGGKGAQGLNRQMKMFRRLGRF